MTSTTFTTMKERMAGHAIAQMSRSRVVRCDRGGADTTDASGCASALGNSWSPKAISALVLETCDRTRARGCSHHSSQVGAPGKLESDAPCRARTGAERTSVREHRK